MLFPLCDGDFFHSVVTAWCCCVAGVWRGIMASAGAVLFSRYVRCFLHCMMLMPVGKDANSKANYKVDRQQVAKQVSNR